MIDHYNELAKAMAAAAREYARTTRGAHAGITTVNVEDNSVVVFTKDEVIVWEPTGGKLYAENRKKHARIGR